MAKSTPIKKTLIDKSADKFPNFEFEGAKNSIFSFGRHTPDNLYEHIIIQSNVDSTQNKGALIITESAVCYNRNWRGIPWFTVGMGIDLAVLKTGKKSSLIDTGWHYFDNTTDGLAMGMDKISEDIQKYILPYFSDCHAKLAQDKVMKAVNDYTIELFPKMVEDDVVSFKRFLKTRSTAYSQWRKDRKKQNLTIHTEADYEEYRTIEPKSVFLEKRLAEIKLSLLYLKLKESAEEKIRSYFCLLFRDYFDFYNLQ